MKSESSANSTVDNTANMESPNMESSNRGYPNRGYSNMESLGAMKDPDRTIPELLAPAGGFDQLQFAIHFGADAVYLACDRFGLRQRAANFSLSEVVRAVDIAHAAAVKVYVTLNASLDNEDITALPEYLSALAEAGVDAFIVSDLGAVRLSRTYAPNVALHISTQASCMNVQAAFAWYEMGARRIVCAREMSVAQIAEMRRQLPQDIELETFVHGAMCMAVSGRCLISDHLNGRSANRGYCTQPCRWKYSLVEETRPHEHFEIEQDSRSSFLLSSKDLNMLHHLDDLIEAGVDSIKIEGRVKKSYYVATVVNAYRQVLDGADPAVFDRDLNAISHRPYSTGFFYGPAAQAEDGPEYFQTHKLAAIVDSDSTTAPAVDSGSSAASAANFDVMSPPASLFETRITLYNRFYKGDDLEVLSPGRPAQALTILGIKRLSTSGDSKEQQAIPTDVADRATVSYLILTPNPLKKRDILRVSQS